ncbi:MAG TPA: peptide chain release factor N(5)-glutamine methyltransferase, partial [Flavisolibacter sp.]|nr:peptide chain release factor N(5)-glutamine methyltransferase [Flavisolibacter sp.]
IENISGLSRVDRLAKNNIDLNTEQTNLLNDILTRLLKHEPIQYMIHKAWFYNLELYVDNSVLIPRPETEELVDWLYNDIKDSGLKIFNHREKKADETSTLKIADIGTGSGCIALALKKLIPGAEVWGFDISDEALNVARRNGSHLDIRVDFQAVNFLDISQQKYLPTVDVVVTNPPYVPLSDKDLMKDNVVKYEPHIALFVPDNDPLIFYKALIHFSRHRIHENGKMYMEIHEDLANQVINLLESEGYKSVELKKDMQGKNRMVKVLI